MSILLAGANGFIGSFLYNRFNKGYSITSLYYSKGLIEDNFFPIDLTQKAEQYLLDKYADKSWILSIAGLEEYLSHDF